MIMMRTIICIFCLVLAQGVHAQFDKANAYFQKKEYAKAIPLYEEALKEKSSLVAKTRLAQCYQILNRMVQAESLFSEIVQEPKARSITYKYYAEALMSNGKYAEAKKWLMDYAKLEPEDSSALQLVVACDEVANLKPFFSGAQIAPAPFNSTEDDNTAVFGPTGLVFTSDRTADKALLKQKSGATGRDFLKLWTADFKDGKWTEPDHYSGKVNSLNANTANASFSKAGDLVAFSRNNTVTSRKGEYKMHLYTAQVSSSGRLDRPEKLDFCNDELNYMHPALFAEGDKIVFSSDSKGEGGMDLFISYNRKGKWSVPRNMGPVINTSRHEAFPYLSKDGRLFFASKGHSGFGGFDLFVSSFDTVAQTWTKPTNLGTPINSPSDDISFTFAPDQQAGTFSSTRGSGNDDVYFFWLNAQEPNWASYFHQKAQTDTISSRNLDPIDGKSGDASSSDSELNALLEQLNRDFEAQKEAFTTEFIQKAQSSLNACASCGVEIFCNTDPELARHKEVLSKTEAAKSAQWRFSLRDSSKVKAVNWPTAELFKI
jgi:tetratricopeptide (TPR) repeat protein